MGEESGTSKGAGDAAVGSRPERAPTRRGPPVRVCIVQELGVPPSALLERTLERAGFWAYVARVRRAAPRRGAFRVIIKPDLDFYGAQSAGTDPVLVEHLIDLLHDHGHTDVAVGDGRNDPDGWLHNRGPLAVPELAGYRFATARGRRYEFVDLSASQADATTATTVPISRPWIDAGFRINFAKNRTHEECGFALAVHNLAGLAAARDAGGAPRRRAAAEDCLEILRHAPPHFSLIDACISAHGGAGQRAPRAMATHACIASPDTLLADWAGAAKMGVDPYASPVNAKALRALGLPAHHAIDGDLAPYPLWRNVHPLIAHSARLRNRSDALGSIAAAWFQSVDRERFPLKDFYNDRINSFIAPLMARIDENPRAFAAIVLLNHLIARIDAAIVAQHTMFAKDRLPRRVAPLTQDPSVHSEADYAAIAGYLEPYEQLLAGTPAHRTGLRWRHVDGSVVFGGEHVLPVAFDAFVKAVDITRAIQYMNDYIGGSTVVVRRDRRGRAVRQVERNLYLQQPNWMVLAGGDVIDVEKIEAIRYAKDRHTIWWRTVHSANASARHDDGSVAFIRDGADRTRIRIFARQQFALPLAFQIFDVNLAPGLRDPIIDSAYTTFFAGTVTNLQAAYEGRDFRIGREPSAEAGHDGKRDLARHLATAAAALAEMLRHKGDLAQVGQWLFGAAGGLSPASVSRPAVVDGDGFRHFAPRTQGNSRDDEALVAGIAAIVRDAPELLSGLVDAVQQDLDRVANPAAHAGP